MRRAALLSLLLLGACASAPREHEPFQDGDRPRATAKDEGTGNCKPFFVMPSHDWGDGAPKHSCWNRLWEIPTAIVVVPLALAFMTSPLWVPILLLK